MYIPKYFQLYEVIPYAFFPKDQELNDKIKCWWLFDDRILYTADRLRERYGKMVCNDWYWKSNTGTDPWTDLKGNQFRGWRPPNCEIGAVMSQHKWGRAIDLQPVECTAEEIRQDILRYRRSKHLSSGQEAFEYITAIEMEVPWLHVDCRNFGPQDIHLIYP